VIAGRAYVLYFTEFSTTAETAAEAAEVNQRRSMLQLREVTLDSAGWLTCNRSQHPPTDGPLLMPPSDANPSQKTRDTPTAIASPEAAVIALAELNRWHGGWYVAEPSVKPPPSGSRVHGVYYDFRLGNGFYREQHSPTAEACVSTCQAESASANCGGMVFKEAASTGGQGADCGVGQTCCYLMTRAAVGPVPQSNCPLPCHGWDSWAAVGIINGTEPPSPTDEYMANFGKWRDPAVASTFFSRVERTGAGLDLVWHLSLQAGTVSKSTGQALAFTWTLAGNGTILDMHNMTSGLSVTPLRQFRRGRPF
jgi:hypothetical protein